MFKYSRRALFFLLRWLVRPWAEVFVVPVVHPYKTGGRWYFNDPLSGIVEEILSPGIGEMIDRLAEYLDIHEPEKGIRLLFSDTPFHGQQARLDWMEEESGGNRYRWDDEALEGWLCPVLLRYFDEAPDSIYAKIEPEHGWISNDRQLVGAITS